MFCFDSLTAWAAQSGSSTPPKGGLDSGFIIMILAVLFFMWLIVLRPQKREREERQKRLEGVKKGDRIVTIGGIHGKVADIDSGRGVLTVEIAPKVTIHLNRSAVATIDTKGGAGAKSGEAVSEAVPKIADKNEKAN